MIDTRGHGRSTRDDRPYTYELLGTDVLSVMDVLHLTRPALVGWSDGACTALILAHHHPDRVAGVFYFACNMDPTGTRPLPDPFPPALHRCFARHAKDYGALSATPADFSPFVDAVSRMQRAQPNHTGADLAQVKTPVAIVQAEHDEFIRPEHAVHLARSIPGAQLIHLSGVSHFAPLQRPDVLNAAMLGFVGKVLG